MKTQTTSMNENRDGTCSTDNNPAWDLSSEYTSYEDSVFKRDYERTLELISALEKEDKKFEPLLSHVTELTESESNEAAKSAREMLLMKDELAESFGNLHVYVHCTLSVNAKDEKAKEFKGVFTALSARLVNASSALFIFLARCTDSVFNACLQGEKARAHLFKLTCVREEAYQLLDLELEKQMTSLKSDGFTAWSTLYDSITGTTKASLKQGDAVRLVGLSEVASCLRSSDRSLREAAYKAQSEAFTLHSESLSSILNSLSGWRITENKLRSKVRKVDFLDNALSQNRMTEETLNAMMSAVEKAKPLAQEALRLQAKVLGVEKLSCYDLLAPCPKSSKIDAVSAKPFSEGLEIVKNAFGFVHPDMASFVEEMKNEKRIEARILDTKRPGAYCTRFPKSRKARVFVSYQGELSDISTLAHELGHAFHGKLLSDLPLAETSYPMNLAETASTFAETALGDYLLQDASKENALALAWSDAQDAATFLLNIPARFAFEKKLYETRKSKPLSSSYLSELMKDTWKDFYGDTLDLYDEHFWKSKLHFYMSGNSFYNFPYTFGYLFSLGIYAQRETQETTVFYANYCSLLRDTGRLKTEALANKHLGVDLTRQDFWQGSIALIAKKIKTFEGLIK